ncbi:C6 transcription factor [Colletotrichum asianum]|uniref:C6 transcription factor n=1 Tax=Colletotrichum asianum TaxID=702518 RepID=A0A8H3ZRW4_9PEZI|nr:C6 transcription factor [Colletotrichum asianum]
MILLHRPFLKSTDSSREFALSAAGQSDIHTVACRKAAQWIARIFRIYKKNFSLRTIPISAVHCAFTAAVIFLADATLTSGDSELRKESLKDLETCFESLQSMSIAWGWSKRAISALQQIARRWDVKITSTEGTCVLDETVICPPDGDEDSFSRLLSDATAQQSADSWLDLGTYLHNPAE